MITLPRTLAGICRAAAATMLLLAVGCGGSVPDDGSVAIRYARWGTPQEIEAERALLREFEAANPGVRVVVEFSSWSEYWTKLQAQLAAGSAPDVFLFSGTHVQDYRQRGQIENLADRAASDPELDMSVFYDAPVRIFTDSDGLWAMPRDCNAIGIFYNKTLFDQHGVSYPEPDWTWDDFLEKARALTIDENGDGRMESFGYLAAFESMEVHWVSWVWQAGGAVLNEDRTRAVLDSPASIRGLQFLSDLVRVEKVSPDASQASTFGSNMFLTGRLAMSSEGSWMIKGFSAADHFQWDVAPLPGGVERVGVVNGLGNAIYSGSKQKDAAWELVKFLSSQTYQESLARSGTSIPALRAVAQSDIYLDGKPEGKKYFLEQIEIGRIPDHTVASTQWESAIREKLELVWMGRMDVETAAREATVAVNAILESRGVSNP